MSYPRNYRLYLLYLGYKSSASYFYKPFGFLLSFSKEVDAEAAASEIIGINCYLFPSEARPFEALGKFAERATKCIT